MTNIFLNGIGIAAPGMCGWEEAQKVLRGQLALKLDNTPNLESDVIDVQPPTDLSSGENRRVNSKRCLPGLSGGTSQSSVNDLDQAFSA